MKKIAVLSALVLLSASVLLSSSFGAGRIAHSSAASGAHAVLPAVDDPPPEPLDCPLCAGNVTVHVRRMQIIQALEAQFMSEAMRW